MDKEKVFGTYNLYYCIHCYKDILKSLENSVIIPIIVNIGCNTYEAAHNNKRTGFFVTTIRSYVNKEWRWKLTNDSRRKIIKDINDNPALK